MFFYIYFALYNNLTDLKKQEHFWNNVEIVISTVRISEVSTMECRIKWVTGTRVSRCRCSPVKY